MAYRGGGQQYAIQEPWDPGHGVRALDQKVIYKDANGRSYVAWAGADKKLVKYNPAIHDAMQKDRTIKHVHGLVYGPDGAMFIPRTKRNKHVVAHRNKADYENNSEYVPYTHDFEEYAVPVHVAGTGKGNKKGKPKTMMVVPVEPHQQHHHQQHQQTQNVAVVNEQKKKAPKLKPAAVKDIDDWFKELKEAHPRTTPGETDAVFVKPIELVDKLISIVAEHKAKFEAMSSPYNDRASNIKWPASLDALTADSFPAESYAKFTNKASHIKTTIGTLIARVKAGRPEVMKIKRVAKSIAKRNKIEAGSMDPIAIFSAVAAKDQGIVLFDLNEFDALFPYIIAHHLPSIIEKNGGNAHVNPTVVQDYILGNGIFEHRCISGIRANLNRVNIRQFITKARAILKPVFGEPKQAAFVPIKPRTTFVASAYNDDEDDDDDEDSTTGVTASMAARGGVAARGFLFPMGRM